MAGLTLMKPQAWNIRVKRISDDLYEFIYEETFAPDAPKSVTDNTFAALEQSKPLYDKMGVGMQIERTACGVRYSMKTRFGVIASMIAGEFLLLSDLGDITIGQLIQDHGISMMKEGGVDLSKIGTKMTDEEKKFYEKWEGKKLE